MRADALELPADPAVAAEMQRGWSGQVRLEPLGGVRTVAGVDVCYDRGVAWCAVVVMSLCDLEVETSLAVRSDVVRPYRPGLLAVREGPAVAGALETLYRFPDCLLVDGHGILHPRGFGLACSIGVRFDVPTIGCAKTPWRAEWTMPGPRRGDWSPVRLDGRTVGATVRTRAGTGPIWVSPGHRCDVEGAVRLVVEASRTRIPEPLKRADSAAREMARLTRGGR